MTIDRVCAAYAERLDEYIEAVGRIEHAAATDRDYVLAWARGVDGRILDVGSGPGQWTDYLRRQGIDVEGVEPTEAFVEDARRRYPAARYRTGRAESLGVEGASIGGVLAWFSLIHIEPDGLPRALAEFARCLAPGGSVLIGFFDGAAREPFDHAVTTAYYWSVEALAELLDRAGFAVTDSHTRADSGVRPQGTIVASRVG